MPTSKISCIVCQIEIQTLDEAGDEISRGTLVGEDKRPLQVALFRGDLKKIEGLEEVLAEKGVKVV